MRDFELESHARGGRQSIRREPNPQAEFREPSDSFSANAPLDSTRLLGYQRLYGNRSVQRLISGKSRTGPALPIQAKGSVRPIQRAGQTIAGGAVIEYANPQVSDILGLLRRLAYQSLGGYAANADFNGNVGPLIDQAIGALLQPRRIPFRFTETRGFNVVWSGTVQFLHGSPESITGGGAATVNRNFGGSGSVSTQTGTSSTDSAKATGGIKAGEAKEGGEVSGGGELGTSTTTSTTTTTTGTTNQGGSTSMNTTLQRFRAPVIVQATVEGELDFSGTDYINPFKWGMGATTALLSNGPQTGEITTGEMRYYISGGIAVPPPNVQRKGALEKELTMVHAGTGRALDPLHFSRVGAVPLPASALTQARDHHGVGVDHVQLIQGAQSDQYCNAMDAVAFCTPNHHGGSDIFMHSSVPIDSPAGQHTLQHEIAHSVQHQKGQTGSLDGLGGDPTVRDQLEKDADHHADTLLNEQYSRHTKRHNAEVE
jgi:hypothetical protein